MMKGCKSESYYAEVIRLLLLDSGGSVVVLKRSSAVRIRPCIIRDVITKFQSHVI